MICILDAGPMIAYLRGETGDDVVENLLQDTANTCYAHAVNLCEVYYDFLRTTDQSTADKAIQTLFADGVNLREDMDMAFWKEVGSLKAAHKIALADCFCLALARRIGGEVVTTDHHEMDSLVPLGICPIQFIR